MKRKLLVSIVALAAIFSCINAFAGYRKGTISHDEYAADIELSGDTGSVLGTTRVISSEGLGTTQLIVNDQVAGQYVSSISERGRTTMRSYMAWSQGDIVGVTSKHKLYENQSTNNSLITGELTY